MNWRDWLFSNAYPVFRVLQVLRWRWGGRLRRSGPDWRVLLSTGPAAPAPAGTRVLVATSVGGSSVLGVEALLAVALRQRAATVDILLCDGVLPACVACNFRRYPTGRRQAQLIDKGPRDYCEGCFTPASQTLEPLDAQVLRYSEFLTEEDKVRAGQLARSISFDEIRSHKRGNSAVGEHAYAGALRFFGRGDLNGEKNGEAILRRYFESALLTAMVMDRMLKSRRYYVAVFHHGIYVPQGIIGESCREHGVRVVNWHQAYRNRRFLFSHGHTYHHTLQSEDVSAWEGIPWSEQLESVTMEYLHSRWTGSKDWISFNRDPNFDLPAIAREVGIDLSRPSVGLLTNVIWDAQLHYPANAFSNMMDWVIETVRYFQARPDLNLIIRVHPAEVVGNTPSRQLTVDELAHAFPVLPPNVYVIPGTSKASTYSLMSACNAVLIYATKTGLELASGGMPVIVAGEAWIRGKGISMDVQKKEGYHEILDRLPLPARLDEATILRARKYAFHFFFRRMIPLPFVHRPDGWPSLEVTLTSLSELLPGIDPGVDTVCNGILNGEPFIYPEERMIDASKLPLKRSGAGDLAAVAAPSRAAP